MDQGLDSSLDGVKDEDSNINISDVIEVIQTTDPDFKQAGMFSGGGEIHQQHHRPIATPTRRTPYVKIIEQPASKALRFRYECEGRSAGSIPGASSTPENKTFPAIQVVNYQGKAIVVVSCVTKDEPYKPHPHNLVGREGCRRGVCTLEIQPDTMAITFSNLGIQCVKKKDIEEALRIREEIRVDPFRTGFAHRNQPTSIDLNAVRLCFQVFLEGETRGKFNVALPAVVSDPIYDKKAMSDLVICRLSHCSGSVLGGDEVILLCEKVAKEDIHIRFYEEKSRMLIWEALADFQPSQVHKQVAITFKTPSYHNREISEPVDVFIQLRRPSDGATSESHTFTYIPTDQTKRRKVLAKYDINRIQKQKSDNLRFDGPSMNITDSDFLIKTEPSDVVPSPLGSGKYDADPSKIFNPGPSCSYQVDTKNVPASQMDYQNVPYVFPSTTFREFSPLTPTNNFNINSPPVVSPQEAMWSPNDYTLDKPATALAVPVENEPTPQNEENCSAGLSISKLMNLDSKELEVFNSPGFPDLDINLSENMQNNFSLSGQQNIEETPQESMTESFTRLTTATIDRICTLNNMYKPNIQE